MLPGLRHPAKLNEIISRVLVVRRDPRGMLLPFQNPSIFQSLIEEHPPLPTQQYPSLMPKKTTILPHSFNFSLLSVIFPNKPPEPGGVSAHSWLGRHPRQPYGRDFPPRALAGPPGSPEKAAREVGVCTQQDAGSTGRQAPSPLGILGPARSLHLVPPAGRCRLR